jgi:hypothetical protein
VLSDIEIARIRAGARELLAAIDSGHVADRSLGPRGLGTTLRLHCKKQIEICGRALGGDAKAIEWLTEYQQRMQKIRARLAAGSSGSRAS